MSEEGGNEPPKWGERRRLPFENTQLSLRPSRGAGVALYALLTLGCVGAAFYMGAIEHRPVFSAYVMAPAIGAVWFAVRLVMMLTPKRDA